MFLFEHIRDEDISTLAPDAQQIFRGIRPLLEQISLDKIDKNNSKVELKKQGFEIRLAIVSKKSLPLAIILDWHSTGVLQVEDVPMDNDNYIDADEFVSLVEKFVNV